MFITDNIAENESAESDATAATGNSTKRNTESRYTNRKHQH